MRISETLLDCSSVENIETFSVSKSTGTLGPTILEVLSCRFHKIVRLAAFAAPDVSWVAWKVDGRIHLRLWTKNEREFVPTGSERKLEEIALAEISHHLPVGFN